VLLFTIEQINDIHDRLGRAETLPQYRLGIPLAVIAGNVAARRRGRHQPGGQLRRVVGRATGGGRWVRTSDNTTPHDTDAGLVRTI
jgi:hypothetical protein